jgi:hypothetical protein
MTGIAEVRALAVTLPRTTEHLVRERLGIARTPLRSPHPRSTGGAGGERGV